MENLSKLGLSAETVRHMTKEDLEDLTGDPTDEVPRVKAFRVQNPEDWEEPPYPDELLPREPEFYTISRDKWIEVETARDAASRFQEQIDSLDSTGLVTAGITRTTRGQHTKYAVSVSVQKRVPAEKRRAVESVSELEDDSAVQTPDITADELKATLPDQATGTVGETKDTSYTVENIPVEFSEGYVSEEACEDVTCEWRPERTHFNEEYRLTDRWNEGIPGGCQIQPMGDSTSFRRATLGLRLYDPDEYTMYMATAAHTAIADGEDSDDAIGREILQPYGGDPIGEIKRVWYHSSDDDVESPIDIALMEPSGTMEARSELAGNNGEISGDLSGDIVAEDDLVDHFPDVCTQGIRSGRCRKEINRITDDGELEIFRTYTEGSGNSGGPYFVEDGDDLLPAAIHRAGDDYLGYGTYIGNIEQELDMEVR
ncbi:hypothetical protein ACFQH2_07075 [Natronoarchaeum sp. GCM10025703]|uniref:hypothetical protein n=1 Tax=unclassified Natronoarchaeum TaxID=2620183 RepID=UPI0036217016